MERKRPNSNDRRYLSIYNAENDLYIADLEDYIDYLEKKIKRLKKDGNPTREGEDRA